MTDNILQLLFSPSQQKSRVALSQISKLHFQPNQGMSWDKYIRATIKESQMFFFIFLPKHRREGIGKREGGEKRELEHFFFFGPKSCFRTNKQKKAAASLEAQQSKQRGSVLLFSIFMTALMEALHSTGILGIFLRCV